MKVLLAGCAATVLVALVVICREPDREPDRVPDAARPDAALDAARAPAALLDVPDAAPTARPLSPGLFVPRAPGRTAATTPARGAAVERAPTERAVEREYARWYDAGLGPHQVEVELLPGGLIRTRVSAGDLYQDPIDPSALTLQELHKRNPAESVAVGAMASDATAIMDDCLDEFRQRSDRPRLTRDLDWRYVWHVRSEGGVGRVLDVDPWWPAAFGARDRACFEAAFDEIERREYVTDAPDFDYRIEAGVYFATGRNER